MKIGIFIMKIGIFILSVVVTVGIMYGAIMMFIKFGLFRNPFKDKWGRWKDDVSRKEQFIWNFFMVMGGLLLGNILGFLLIKLGILHSLSPITIFNLSG